MVRIRTQQIIINLLSLLAISANSQRLVKRISTIRGKTVTLTCPSNDDDIRWYMIGNLFKKELISEGKLNFFKWSLFIPICFNFRQFSHFKKIIYQQ